MTTGRDVPQGRGKKIMSKKKSHCVMKLELRLNDCLVHASAVMLTCTPRIDTNISQHMNSPSHTHIHKNSSKAVFFVNGDNVRRKLIPCGYNYNITDNNLRLPLRFPRFSSEGQVRGRPTNYRLIFSPVTWYLSGQRTRSIRLSYIVCVYRDVR